MKHGLVAVLVLVLVRCGGTRDLTGSPHADTSLDSAAWPDTFRPDTEPVDTWPEEPVVDDVPDSAHTGCRDDMDCDDADMCTEDECDSGICMYHEVECDDADECTEDGCDPDRGCTHIPIPMWWPDGDGDGAGRPGPGVCRHEAPDGHVGNDDDCCDSDGIVHPGHTEYHCEAYVCDLDTSATPSFDYDCDGSEEERWTGTGTCSIGYGYYCFTDHGWIGVEEIPDCGATARWLDDCDHGTGGCHATDYSMQCQECR
jgi:hypothetical protein